MINKPRFRKGKKAVRKWKDGKPLTGNEQKMSLRYQFAILRWTMERMIAGATSMAVAKSAMRAATGAMQIGVLQSVPTPRDEDPEKAKKMKVITIAQSVIHTAKYVNEAFAEAAEASQKASESFSQLSKALLDAKRGIALTTFTLIFFLVTSCVTVPKGHDHSRKQHRLETTPKAQ